MANEKILNTRIQLKYDSLVNWSTNNPVLKAGEVAIAYLGSSHTTTTPDNGTHPVLFKVGPGNFNSLPWVSGLAADVYGWAKKENPDWTDFPALPLSVVDNGSGKFVTGFTYTDNKLTITRSDVAWADVQNKPNLVNSITAEDTSLVINPTTGDVKAKVNRSTVEGNILELKDDGLYVPAPVEVTLPSVSDEAVAFSFVTEVEQASGAVSNNKAKLVQGENIALAQEAAGGDITISGKDWSGEIATALADAKKYADDNDANDNTAHSHVDGVGVKVTGNGGIDGEVKIDLDVKFNPSLVTKEDKKYLQLLDATDSALITEFDVTEFIKDGMLDSVSVDESANKITFVWNTDGAKTETVVELSKIADIYTAKDTETIDMEVSNTHEISAIVKTNSLKDGHIATDAAIAETKLAQGVQDALALARSALQEHQSLENYKTKQQEYSAEGSTVKTVTKVEQNANGEVTVTYGEIAFPDQVDISGKKDKQTAVDNKITSAAHVLSTLSQNENGEVAYEVKELTPADIGAQPAGDYATKTEMSNQDAAILAEAQKYADSLNHEDTKYTAAADGGLKLNENNEFAIDDSVTFVFYCGSATELI